MKSMKNNNINLFLHAVLDEHNTRYVGKFLFLK